MPAVLYLCIHLRDFAAQALARKHKLGSRPLAILSGMPPLELVFACNEAARKLGIKLGMSRVQAESFAISLFARDRRIEDQTFSELLRTLDLFSPRIETIASPEEDQCGATLMLDISGSERLLGPSEKVAFSALHCMREIGLEASAVISHNACAALLAARQKTGASVIAAGDEIRTLAPLPLAVLEPNTEQSATFAAWGVHTLGELAALPTKSLVARMGQSGLLLQTQARGAYKHLLVPKETPPEAPIHEQIDLEYPVDQLEPLLFLLSQMLEAALRCAAERSLAIASVETTLIMERTSLSLKEQAIPTFVHRRRVSSALPERNRMTLLKLIQLDLELHPPEAAVIGLQLTAYPARVQSAQNGLFAAQAPESGRMEILLARLRKLVGEEHVGSPELLDTHAPENFRNTPFTSSQSPPTANVNANHTSAMRMLRPPHAVVMELREKAPSAMCYEGQRWALQTCSGPWRTNGAWWTHPAWCREEWDVTLRGSSQRCLRLAHDPAANCWYVIGIYD